MIDITKAERISVDIVKCRGGCKPFKYAQKIYLNS